VCLQALREELEQHKVRTFIDASAVPRVFRCKLFIFVDFFPINVIVQMSELHLYVELKVIVVFCL